MLVFAAEPSNSKSQPAKLAAIRFWLVLDCKLASNTLLVHHPHRPPSRELVCNKSSLQVFFDKITAFGLSFFSLVEKDVYKSPSRSQRHLGRVFCLQPACQTVSKKLES